MHISKAGFIAAAVLSFSSIARAEIIKLKSGQEIEGTILKESKDSILLDAGIDTPVTYFRDEIQAILPQPQAPAVPVEDVHQKADTLENQAVELIAADQMERGLALMDQAIALDPAAQRWMNYGSVLFGNGVSLFKSGRTEEGLKILRQAETQLLKAIAGFDKNKDAVFLGQSYFLLGEMYHNAFNDPDQAQEYYQKSADFGKSSINTPH